MAALDDLGQVMDENLVIEAALGDRVQGTEEERRKKKEENNTVYKRSLAEGRAEQCRM